MRARAFLKIISFQLFSVLMISACTGGTQNKKPEAVQDTSHTSVDGLASEIAGYSTVDEKYVGIAGTTSGQYQRFVRLEKNATEAELVGLMGHESANVRAYAFWALVKRNYPHLKSLVKDKANDTASIRHFSGCTILEYPVRDFYNTVMNRK